VLATAGVAPALASCAPAPPEKLLPYLIPPEDVVPGVAAWYATTCRECPAGCGMLVRVREGRAVKAEGHPGHPLNRGALCVRGQAALQGLYDPDRVAGPYRRDRATSKLSWDDGLKALAASIRALREAGRADRIAFVTPLLTGSLDALVDRWLKALGGGTRIRYEPFAYEPLREAGRRAFGKDAIPRFDFAAARMIVSFGADFLETWLSNVAAARAFREARSGARGRRAEFVHLEARRSLTAASADTWLSAEPGSERDLALAMARVILEEAPARLADAREREALRRVLQDHTPERAAARSGLGADAIRQLALRFAGAEPGLAVGGGVAASGPDATEAQVAIHLLTTSRATSAAPSSSARTPPTRARPRIATCWLSSSACARARSSCCWCPTPTPRSRCPPPPASPRPRRACRTSSASRAASTRPRRSPRWGCRRTRRSRPGATTSRSRACAGCCSRW